MLKSKGRLGLHFNYASNPVCPACVATKAPIRGWPVQHSNQDSNTPLGKDGRPLGKDGRSLGKDGQDVRTRCAQIPTRSAPIPSWALRAGVRHRDHRTRWPVVNAAVVQPIVGTRSPGAVEAMGAPTLGMLHVHVCVVCVLSEEISYIRDTRAVHRV